MRARCLLYALILLILAPRAHAWTADELIARYLQARGGRTKLAAIHSLRITGKTASGQGDFVTRQPITTLIKRPGLVRAERSMQGLTAVTAFDGREGWSLQPFGGRREPQKLAPDAVKSLRLQADIDGPLVDYQAKGNSVAYLGTEDVDGTEAHKLQVTLRDGDILYIYLDPDYFLEIREVSETRVRGVEQESETDFGNYEKVAGVYMPFSIESGAKGEPKGTKVTVEKIETNVPLADSLFHFPATAAGAGR